MINKRSVLRFFVTASLAALAVAGCGSSSKEKLVVGIFPATIDTFTQFQDEFKKTLTTEKGVTVEFLSAEGDPSRFQTVVSAALLKKPQVLVICGTQLTNTALATKFENELPRAVSSCISDPSRVETLNAIGIDSPRKRPVAVLSDMPKKDRFKMAADVIRIALPSGKRAGIMFNSAEINAKNMAERMTAALNATGWEVIVGNISADADVDKIAKDLLTKGVELLVLPQDKTVIKNARVIVKLGDEAAKAVPVFALDDGAVRKDGAAFGVAISAAELGRQTAEVTRKILAGAKPEDMPLVLQESASVYINQEGYSRHKLAPLSADFAAATVKY